MKKTFLAALLFLLAALPIHALELGDNAPEISAEAWVTGDEADPTKIDGKTFYLVEVWSVTCPPCVRSIPIMNDIQKRYADEGLKIVSFTTDELDEVKEFLSEHPMEYSSFIDKEGASFINYMAADNRSTIPHAFLFDKAGALVWIGNPLDNLEMRVKQVIAGDLNREKAIAIRDARDDLQNAFAAQNIDGMLENFKKLESLEPDNISYYQVHHRLLTELGAGDENDVRELLDAWYKGAYNQPEGMAMLSMVAMEQGAFNLRNPKMALDAAKRSFAIESDIRLQAGINLADIYRAIGRVDLAIKTLDEVNEIAADADERESVESIREFYRKISELGKTAE